MVYDASEVGSLRFLAGNLIFQLTSRMMGGGNAADVDALDDAALLMDVVSSYYTEEDKMFKQEWASLQRERDEATRQGYLPGVNSPEKDLDFRFRELKCMFRSLCRSGVFVHKAPDKTQWVVEQ